MKVNTKIILDGIVFLFMLLFIYAAAYKLLDFKNFTHYIDVYSPFGRYVSSIIALAIPLTELCIAGLLFTSRFRLVGLYASAALMLGFTSYIGYYAIFSITQRPCACGGILNNMEWTEHLIFNIAFTLLGIIGIFFHAHQSRSKYITSTSY